MKFHWFIIFTAMTSSVIFLSSAARHCYDRFHPFKAHCVTECMKVKDKLRCYDFGLQILLEKYPSDEIVIVADDDVLFTDWSEEYVEETLRSFGDGLVVMAAEENLHPHQTYFEGEGFYGPYLNAGVFVGRLKQLASIFERFTMAHNECRKIGVHDTGLQVASLPYTSTDFLDQGILQMFYLNSPNKPLVLDTDRVFSFAVGDLFYWKPQESNGCRIPKRDLDTALLPGEDVCPRLAKRGGKKSAALDKCTRDRTPGQYFQYFLYPLDCKKAFEINGCDVSLKFKIQPLSVLQKVPTPLAFHFLDNSMKYTFSKVAEEQNMKCTSPYKPENMAYEEFSSTITPIFQSASFRLFQKSKKFQRRGRH